MPSRHAVLVSGALLAMAAGCGDSAAPNPYVPLDPEVPPVTSGAWYRPTVNTTWQWQLSIPDGESAPNTSYDVNVYDLDLFDTDASLIATLHGEGRAVVCYFSAGSWEDWREDAGAFPAEVLGRALDGWEGERWLDIRAPVVLDLMLARLDLAVSKGCDGVEPDNVDGYTNGTGFALNYEQQLAFDRHLANAAHERGLAVGLKNSGDQAAELVDYYDFSLNEQCHEYDECDQLAPFTDAGKPIWNAEYASPDSEAAALSLASTLCPVALAEDIRTLVLPLELDDAFRVSCD